MKHVLMNIIWLDRLNSQTHVIKFTHTKQAFWLPLSGHAYSVTSTGVPVHYSSTVKPKVSPGSPPTMQDIHTHTHTHNHTHTHDHTHTELIIVEV